MADLQRNKHSAARVPAIPETLWPLMPGAIGFLAGYIGPIELQPQANQGPLLGIFVSGPGGAVMGVILGVICRRLKVSITGQIGVLVLSATLVGLVTLGYCLPDPELRGYAREVQVNACQRPAQVVDSAVDYWNGRIAATKWATPRAGWEAESRAKSETANGVVLDVTILREDLIELNKKPWNKGKLSARAGTNYTIAKSFYADFAGNSCANYPVAKRLLLFSPYENSGVYRGPEYWPPPNLADFLDRARLELLPDDYRKIVSE